MNPTDRRLLTDVNLVIELRKDDRIDARLAARLERRGVRFAPAELS